MSDLGAIQMITPSQIRAARGLLQWTQGDLASRSGVSAPAITNIELEKQQPTIPTLEKIERAFTSAGVEIMRDGGVRPRQSGIVTYEGRQGFALFRQDVLETAKSGPVEICVSNVDEREFDKWGQGSVNDHYVAEMAKIKTFQFRILVQEGDTYFTGSQYARYRWLPQNLFGKISFYIYGSKTAIISFQDNNFSAFILHNNRVTDFYREEFDRLWEIAKPADGKSA